VDDDEALEVSDQWVTVGEVTPKFSGPARIAADPDSTYSTARTVLFDKPPQLGGLI
jgi:hypothetical protein